MPYFLNLCLTSNKLCNHIRMFIYDWSTTKKKNLIKGKRGSFEKVCGSIIVKMTYLSSTASLLKFVISNSCVRKITESAISWSFCDSQITRYYWRQGKNSLTTYLRSRNTKWRSVPSFCAVVLVQFLRIRKILIWILFYTARWI